MTRGEINLSYFPCVLKQNRQKILNVCFLKTEKLKDIMMRDISLLILDCNSMGYFAVYFRKLVGIGRGMHVVCR